MSREQRFSLYVILSIISRGRALGGLGQLREAKLEIQLGLDEARSKGVGFMLPMMNSWLADMHARSGKNETALSIVEQVLANGHLEKFLSPSRHESDSVIVRGHGRMERAGHGADGLFRC